jgi:hypothetical protein
MRQDINVTFFTVLHCSLLGEHVTVLYMMIMIHHTGMQTKRSRSAARHKTAEQKAKQSQLKTDAKDPMSQSLTCATTTHTKAQPFGWECRVTEGGFNLKPIGLHNHASH